MTKPRSVAPIIVANLLLLPVLYVGSYFAMVVPGPISVTGSMGIGPPNNPNYRSHGAWESRFFWPLEELDRKIRPRAWDGLGEIVGE
jgi:hypothetical protein